MFSEIALTDNLDIVSAILDLSTITGAFNLFCADKNIRHMLYAKLPDILLNTFSNGSSDYSFIDYSSHHFIVDLIKSNELFIASYCFTICTESPILYIPELLYINKCEYCDRYYNCCCDVYDYWDMHGNYNDLEKLSIEYLITIIKMRKKCQLVNSILDFIFQKMSDVSILFPVIYKLFLFEGYEWEQFQDELIQYVEKYGLRECVTILENSIETKNISMLQIFARGRDVCQYQDNLPITLLIKKGIKIYNEWCRDQRFGCIINNVYYKYDIDTELPPRKCDTDVIIKNDAYHTYKEILDKELDEYMNLR